MQPTPFTIFPATVVFDALLAVFAIGEIGIRVISARNSSGQQGRPEWTSFAILVAAFAVAFAGSFLAASRVTAAAIPFARWAFFVAALVVMAAGIALRWWSVVILGRSFTVQVRVRDGQTVVDRGPFGVVRHPSYTGLLLVFLGMGLGLGNWLAFIAALVPTVAALLYRIRVEEATLIAGLGDDYREYLRRVRYRLIPRIY